MFYLDFTCVFYVKMGGWSYKTSSQFVLKYQYQAMKVSAKYIYLFV